MELKQLQTIFCGVVTKKNEDDENNKQRLLEIIIAGGTLSPEGALLVYAQDYSARMREALGTNYEATWLMLGDEEFFLYADQYIKSYPSDLANLTYYGEYFPEMLAEQGLDLASASKMAVLERAFWKFFHAADQAVLAVDEEMIKEGEFNLSQFVFIESEMRLDLVWTNRELGATAIADLELYEDSYFLIYKAENRVIVQKLNPQIFNFLIELREHKKIVNIRNVEVTSVQWPEILDILKHSKTFLT